MKVISQIVDAMADVSAQIEKALKEKNKKKLEESKKLLLVLQKKLEKEIKEKTIAKS